MIELDDGWICFRRGGVIERHAFSLPCERRCGAVLVKASVEEGRTRVELVPEGDVELKEVVLAGACVIGDADRVLVNGYQSWTDTRERAPSEKIARMLPPLSWFAHPFGDSRFVSVDGRSGRFHGFCYGYVRRGDNISFVGQLSELGGYTIVAFDAVAQRVELRADVDGCVIDRPLVVFDTLSLRGGDDEVFAAWANARGVSPSSAPPLSGWCSWYRHFTNVNEGHVLSAARGFRELGVEADVIQIDDGYQREVGDWLDVNTDKFPRGMAAVASELREMHYTPGLWLAPFVASSKSALFRAHAHDWFEQDSTWRGKKPVRAGYNPMWGGSFYALDFDNDDARAYVAASLTNASERWGFSFLKLDFLYAAGLRHRRNAPRGARMHKAMTWLRQLLPSTTLLGCGVPLGPAFGLVDYCRIGCDVAPTWDDRIYRWFRVREGASTVRSLESTVGRRHLDRRAFVNDADVFILRSRDVSLDEDERRTLLIVNATLGGLFFVSDDVDRYDEAACAELRSLFPLPHRSITSVIHEHPRVDISLDVAGRRYRVLANLGEQRETFYVDDGLCFERARGLFRGSVELGRHQSVVVHVIDEVRAGRATLAGTAHLFPGADIDQSIDDSAQTLRLRPRAATDGLASIVAPIGSGSVRVNGADWVVVDHPSLAVAVGTISCRHDEALS